MTLNGVMTLFMSYFTKFGSFQGRTQICRAIFAIKARIDNRKKNVKQQYLLHVSPQYGELQPTSG